MGLSVAVAALCSLPLIDALTCTYQVEKAGKCEDPKCPTPQYIWTKDGACKKCDDFKRSSKDRKDCVDPTCD
jgi:hypothetical protein